MSLLCEDTGRSWVSISQEGSSHQNPLCWHLALGLPAAWTVRNKRLWFKSPSLWYFLMGDWTKTLGGVGGVINKVQHLCVEKFPSFLLPHLLLAPLSFLLPSSSCLPNLSYSCTRVKTLPSRPCPSWVLRCRAMISQQRVLGCRPESWADIRVLEVDFSVNLCSGDSGCLTLERY